MRARAGLSLVEVLLCLALLATIVVPIIDMFMNSAHVTVTSGRLVEVSLHGQMLLEALSQIEPRDLPQTTLDQEELVAADGLASGPSGEPRYQAWRAAFQKKPPFPMQRSVTIRRRSTGEAELGLMVTWQGTEGEEKTRQRIHIHMLSTPTVFGR